MAVKKSRQFPGFLIYSQFNDSAFTAANCNAKFQTRFERGTICQLKILCKGGRGTFSFKRNI